ncbi:hypothetical protein DOY81_004123 [Sarcophaga bullata]|nr:hypothetical protein DOY81_004123 [Sarcophaga bullata]
MEDILENFGMSFPGFKSIYQTLSRKKPIEDSSESKLAKVLSAFDLTTLGIGSTLGVGVYVLAGQVSKIYAGPAVIFSFLIAAIASIFAGLCYAEFGARVPRAGSAYVYSYVTIGEFIAFIIGWNLILEYAIGSASVVKGLSAYLDNLCGHAMENFLSTNLPMNIDGLNEYPDIFAFGVTIIFAWAIAMGAKESTRLNTVFTLLNLSVVVFVIGAGLFKGNPFKLKAHPSIFINISITVSTSNWALPKSSVPEGYGDGGFAPYGFAGIIRGAAICFYGFIGFDCIATAGEEAKNPKKSIPFAVITSLAMVFLAYFGISTVLTMMLPYYEQDESAPLVHVFSIYGWTAAKYIVSIGAICAMCTSLMGSMFPLPRIVYAMANDGLLFKFMGEINSKHKTPLNSTLLTGLLTGAFAAIFNLKQLMNMMSIGTFLAYSMVAACVLILRYESGDRRDSRHIANGRVLSDYNDTNSSLLKMLFNTTRSIVPTKKTSRTVTIMICIYVCQCILLTHVLKTFEENFSQITVVHIVKLSITVLSLIVTLFIISRQPVASSSLAFKVPFVPWVPGFSLLINIYLMIKLDIMTWVRFSIWIAIGLVIFFVYSIRNSSLRRRDTKIFSNSESRGKSESNSLASLQNDERFSTQVPLMIKIMVQQPSYWKVLTRRKQLSQEGADGESKLNRVLGLYDLTALGVGSTLGAGVYVLAGQIAKDQAGPSVMLSFAIAALASLLAGVCYAEFGARVPKAGSAYVYSYVCIGEFAAFVIGWNLILEYMIGTASVCRGISLYLDTLINDTLKTTFAEVAPMNISFLGSYFDFFACGLVVVFGVALAFGVETSAIANNFCTCLNLSILLFVIIAGSVKANFSNWSIDVDAVNKTDMAPDTELGAGGFFPFGFTGTLKGAATCFFGFVGFDCIATTGEEVQNPRKNIPRSILLSLLVIFLCYFGVSTVITLMVPYYLQDPNAPLPSAFKLVGWDFAMWIVSIGGLVGLLASLFGALFPLPRVMYSMAQDGLMFGVFGRIHPRYRVPVAGSVVAAMLTALIAGLFDLAQLVSLLSIGTLLAYSVVAISITILRYMDNSDTLGTTQSNGNLATSNIVNGHGNGISNGNGNGNGISNGYTNGNGHNTSESSLLTSKGERITFKAVLRQLFNFRRVHIPNELSTRIVGTLITLFCVLSAGIGLIFMHAYDALINNQTWVLVLMIVLCLVTALVLLCICLQPRELDVMTWIRFAVWMAIACWCMNDIKNPALRHPDRVQFEKLMKLSSKTPTPHTSKELTTQSQSNLNQSVAASTLIMQQNERSVKSFDDIMELNEVVDDLKEFKHPNGQICYIEDDKSAKSQTSLNKPDDDEFKEAPLKTDTSEEEKSVIALLDDVLQNEDENINNSQLSHAYNRKLSVDSELMPSVIRSTTVATVHNSSSGSSEKDSIQSSRSKSIDSGMGSYEAKHKVAQDLVDEILNSEALWLALEKHKYMLHQATTTEVKEKISNPMKRVQSVESVLSTSSVDDPLHSEKFRNKLSQIIIKPPEPKPIKELSKELKNSPQEDRPMLKQSKSEADVRALVLKAIEGCNINMEENNSGEKDHYIPKPPKFDPILYKTINSIGRPKERPRLDKLLENKNIPPLSTLPTQNEPITTEVPFKQKLEAILIRGPSHKMQTQQSINETKTKSSQIPLLIEKSNPNQIKSNLNDTLSTLEDTRKALRPVKSKFIDL